MWSALDLIEQCIDGVNAEVERDFGNVTDISKRHQIQWLQRQANMLLQKLCAIKADMEAGLSCAELGFADEQEMMDFLSDTQAQIAQLQSRAKTIEQSLGYSR